MLLLLRMSMVLSVEKEGSSPLGKCTLKKRESLSLPKSYLTFLTSCYPLILRTPKRRFP